MIVNFVVDKCLMVQWKQFRFDTFLWNGLLHDICCIFSWTSSTKICMVSVGTASCTWLCIGADLYWHWLCWLYWFGYFLAGYVFLDLCSGRSLFVCSLLVQYSSILVGKVVAFFIAFAIYSVLFSGRVLSVSNWFCNFGGTAGYHLMISDIIISIICTFTM